MVEHSSIDTRQYRHTIGQFATGVTVVTTGLAPEVSSMTVNTIASVSLEPTMLLFCAHKDARIMEPLQRQAKFNVSILSADQRDLSTYFAGLWEAGDVPEFEFVEWAGGVRIAGCLAALACEVGEIFDGGDHWIIIGHVLALHRNAEPGDPLIFYAGQYHRLAEDILD